MDLSNERAAKASLSFPVGTIRLSAFSGTSASDTNSEVIRKSMRFSVYKAKKSSSSIDPIRDAAGNLTEVASSEEPNPTFVLKAGHYHVVGQRGFDMEQTGVTVVAGSFVEKQLYLNIGSLKLATALPPKCRAFDTIYHAVYSENETIDGERLLYDEARNGNLTLSLPAGTYSIEYGLGSKMGPKGVLGAPEVDKSGVKAKFDKIVVTGGEQVVVKAQHQLGCASFGFLANGEGQQLPKIAKWKIFDAEQRIRETIVQLPQTVGSEDEKDAKPAGEVKPIEPPTIQHSDLALIKLVAQVGPRSPGIVLQPRFDDTKTRKILVDGVPVEFKIHQGYVAQAVDRNRKTYSRFFTVKTGEHAKVLVGTWQFDLPPLKPLPPSGF